MPDRHYYLGPWVWRDDADDRGWHAPEHTVGLVDLRPLRSVDSFGFFATSEPLGSDYTSFGDQLDGPLAPAERSLWASMLGMVDTPPGPTLLDVLWQTLGPLADPDGDAHALPILPTHRRVKELHLGGHSLARAERFGGLSDPFWSQYQIMLQRSYARLYNSGDQIIERLERDPDLRPRTAAERDAIRQRQRITARKWLGAQALKYRLTPEQASGLLIPAGLPRELPLRPTTTVRDDFVRSNRFLHGDEATWSGALQGWTWVQKPDPADPQGDDEWQIVSNGAQSVTNGNYRLIADSALSSADHENQGLLSGNNEHVFGPMTRCSAGSQQGFEFVYDGLNSTKLRRRAAGGATTELDASALSFPSSSRTMILRSDGSTHQAWTLKSGDQVLRHEVTDTNFPEAVNIGMTKDFRSDKFTSIEASDLLASALAFAPAFGPAGAPAWAPDAKRPWRS